MSCYGCAYHIASVEVKHGVAKTQHYCKRGKPKKIIAKDFVGSLTCYCKVALPNSKSDELKMR